MAAAARSACERSRILATPVHTCTTKPLHARRSGPFRATQNQKSTLLFLDQQTFVSVPACLVLAIPCGSRGTFWGVDRRGWTTTVVIGGWRRSRLSY
eukprot:scaffold12244_cov216-Isochrysis_galbana.AAC.3